MTAIIKAVNVRVCSDQRRKLARTVGAAPTAHAHSLADELKDAKKRIVLMESDLEEAAETLPIREREAFDRGQSEGKRIARAANIDDNAKRLALIERALLEAHETFVASLNDKGRLALELAAAALNKVIGSTDDYHDLLARSIAHHVRTLSDETMICARVSSEDFSTDKAMAGLRERLPGHVRGRILAMPDLPTGTCLIQLESGEIDAGLHTQLAMLAKILDGQGG